MVSIDRFLQSTYRICTIVGKTKSYFYAMPNKLFESTMAGLPVVASNYPGMGKFVTDNKMGIICDPESAEGISATKYSNRVIKNCESNLLEPQGSHEPNLIG